jgi:chromosome segregation ATPase
MKTSIKTKKNESRKSVSVLKRARATKLSIAPIADDMKTFKAGVRKELDKNQKQIRLLDDKVVLIDTVSHSIDHTITQLQSVLLSVNETFGVQTQAIATALNAAEEQYQERYTAIDNKVNTMGEVVHSFDEKNARQYEAMESRIQMLEERIPHMETNVKSLESTVDSIAQLQHKINARIIAVMRMSLMIIGVLGITAVVLGFIYFKR